MSRTDTVLKYFRQHEDYLNDRVREGIENCRKGDFTLELVDKNGQPVRDAHIRYCHKNHEFRHGANLFMLDEFEQEEKNRLYRQAFAETFNLATLPFYWRDQEPEKGKTRYGVNSPRIYRRPPVDLCLNYCAEKGIEPKAHCLNYDFMRPEWLHGADVATYKAALEARMADLSARYAEVIPSWEVTNETLNEPFCRDVLLKRYSTFYLERDFVAWSFEKAMKYFPNNRLIINDHQDFGCMRSLMGEYFGARSMYYMQIERLLESGLRVDSAGFQYHCFLTREQEEQVAVARYNPVHLYDILDTYQALGCRLQITEMTVSALGPAQEDEEIQAELIRNLYSVFFSHPAMEAIIYWNLPDGYAAGAKAGDMTVGESRYYGGLYRFDMSEKPAIRAIRRLFREQWHTEAEAAAVEGRLPLRGFYGDYVLRITHGGRTCEKTVPLYRAQAGKTIRIVLG